MDWIQVVRDGLDSGGKVKIELRWQGMDWVEVVR